MASNDENDPGQLGDGDGNAESYAFVANSRADELARLKRLAAKSARAFFVTCAREFV